VQQFEQHLAVRTLAGIATTAWEIAARAVLGLEMADDRLNRGAALHFAADRAGRPSQPGAQQFDLALCPLGLVRVAKRATMIAARLATRTPTDSSAATPPGCAGRDRPALLQRAMAQPPVGLMEDRFWYEPTVPGLRNYKSAQAVADEEQWFKIG
jgi:hypothetical protein